LVRKKFPVFLDLHHDHGPFGQTGRNPPPADTERPPADALEVVRDLEVVA